MTIAIGFAGLGIAKLKKQDGEPSESELEG